MDMLSNRSRAEVKQITGNVKGSVYPASGTNYSLDREVEKQFTRSRETGWPLARYFIESEESAPIREKYPHIAAWFLRQDWGAGFYTSRNTLSSNYDDSPWAVTGRRGNIGTWASCLHDGPVFLNGFTTVPSHPTDQQVLDEQTIMYGLGGTAIARVRPNKPVLDSLVTLGELKKDGLPTLIGSLALRSRTVRDLFRNGSKEYLNTAFGWGPLVSDLMALCKAVRESRARIEQFERDIDKLVRRRYQFPDQIETVQGLSKTLNDSNYGLQVGTPLGASPDHFGIRPAGQAPTEITKTTAKSWFSGGFRYGYLTAQEGLREIARFEAHANLLLGTRIDPEVLWNLAPWSWLTDWFFNFGDVLGNISAWTNNESVMQYGYIMRETIVEKEITYPLGLWYAHPTNSFTFQWRQVGTGPYTMTVRTHRKMRAKASPFGFGLNPSDFTSDQWAILGALGITRLT